MAFKNCKKMIKWVFLFTGLELEKVLELRPPLFFNFRGGHTSSILQTDCTYDDKYKHCNGWSCVLVIDMSTSTLLTDKNIYAK